MHLDRKSLGWLSLGSLIRQAGLSRELVAEKLGVSIQTIHNWSQRRTSPSLRYLQSLAEILTGAGVDPSAIKRYLFTELETQGLDVHHLVGTSGSYDSGLAPSAELTGPILIAVWRMAGSPMASIVASACRSTLEHFGHRCLLVDCGGNRGFAVEAIRSARPLNSKGIVLFVPGTLPDPATEIIEVAGSLGGDRSPVLFGQFWTDSSKLPERAAAVRWDSKVIAQVAAEALAEAGHTKVGLVLGGTESTESAIGHSFVGYAEEKGMVVAGIARASYPSPFTDSICAAARRSTALFVDSPSALPVVGHALNEMRLRWPVDISVLGVGSAASVLQAGERPFTIVNVPLQEMGQHAAQLLLGLLDNAGLPLEKRYIVYGRETISVVGLLGGSMGPPSGRILGQGA